MFPVSPWTVLILTSNMAMDLRDCFSLFGVDWPGARLKIEVQPWKFEWAARQSAPHHPRVGKPYQDQSLNPQLIVGGMRIDDDNNAFRIKLSSISAVRSIPSRRPQMSP
jgi:hypothetical protein